MPRRSARLLFLLAIFTASEAAFSQTSDDIASRLFARLDRDRNGAVTALEFSFVRSVDFQRLDRDRDSYLSRAEFIENRSPKNAISARARRLRSLRIRRFSEVDSDRDGRLARREYMVFGRGIFARLDRNGDGKLTLGEARSRRASATNSLVQPRNAGLFEQIDINRDRTISLSELLAARRIVFKRLDTDKNGAISMAEFAARETTITGQSGQAPPPRSALPVRASPRFLQLDRNRNGQVTPREYLADGKARFAGADRDGNRRLTRAEFEGGAGR